MSVQIYKILVPFYGGGFASNGDEKSKSGSTAGPCTSPSESQSSYTAVKNAKVKITKKNNQTDVKTVIKLQKVYGVRVLRDIKKKKPLYAPGDVRIY